MINKNSRVAIWSKSLSVILFFMIMLMFLPLIYHFGLALQPVEKSAINGKISLLPEDYSARRTAALVGDWSFFWQKLLQPEQINDRLSHATLLNGRAGWQSIRQSKPYDAIGYATYHLDITLLQPSQHLALYVPQIESAYRLYINSELVESGGTVSDTESLSMPGYHAAIINIPDGLNAFSITLQISNFHSGWGGIWAPIVLGETTTLHTINRDKVALSLFIMGVLLITIIHSLIQFFLRPIDSVPLVFACVGLLLLLREFTLQHMDFILSSFSGGFFIINKLNFFSFYAGIPAALYFFHACYPRIFHKRLCVGLYSICLSFALFILLFPTQYIGISVLLFQPIAFAVMLYIVHRLWVAMHKKQKGAGVMLLGSLIAFAFALNDILNMNSIITTGRFFSLGIVGFIMCQSYVTNNRFNHFINKNAALTKRLKERNSDLEHMSELLESKVEQRTMQLQLANKELKALANNDALTNTLNRHGLQQHIQSAFERYRRKDEPFSLILIDYDHFKEINDIYGHDVGDLVLLCGCDLIKAGIREQDKLARWGGEEFLVLLPDTHLEGAMAIANKLKLAINAKPIGQPIGVTVSVTGGVAQVLERDNFDSLFKRADDALYRGKEQGRNCVVG